MNRIKGDVKIKKKEKVVPVASRLKKGMKVLIQLSEADRYQTLKTTMKISIMELYLVKRPKL